jgi:hypothetical protein
MSVKRQNPTVGEWTVGTYGRQRQVVYQADWPHDLDAALNAMGRFNSAPVFGVLPGLLRCEGSEGSREDGVTHRFVEYERNPEKLLIDWDRVTFESPDGVTEGWSLVEFGEGRLFGITLERLYGSTDFRRLVGEAA